MIPPECLAAALVGDGLMETVRVQRGTPLYPELHVRRLVGAADACGYEIDGLEERLGRALARGVSDSGPVECAAARVFAYPSDEGPVRVFVDVAPWSPPSAARYAAGVRLHVSSVVHPGNGRFGKTTSRHWSRTASRLAHRAGFDCAMVCDRDGHVVESATATPVWFRAGRAFTPAESLGGLPSTTLVALERDGLACERASADVASLADVDGLVLLSSLRLAIGVRSVGDVELAEPDVIASELRLRILGDAP